MEKLKVSEYLNSIEEFETYNIIRFSAFVIYLEFVLNYFFKTSFFNFVPLAALSEFVLANWLTLIFVWLIYYPVQNVGKHASIAIGRLFFDPFWALRRNERNEYKKMKNEGFIINLEVADEVVRRYSDKKLEKEIEQIVDSRKKHIVSKMRLGIIFALLLTNAILFWYDYSGVELLLKTNFYQTLALFGLAVWIGYPEPESHDYVCAPRYLKVQEIEEIENDNFFTRNRRRQKTNPPAKMFSQFVS